MRILSINPCSIYQNGGAGRLLRRIFEGKESLVTSIYVSTTPIHTKRELLKEYEVLNFPLQKKWMRWKLRNIFTFIRNNFFKKSVIIKINNIEKTLSYDVLHIINQGKFANTLIKTALENNKKIWASFHDHYLLCSTFQDTNELWQKAHRRLVISEELGKQYQKEFGIKDFEIITDGLKIDEISTPKTQVGNPLIIYFGGLLHIGYYPYFKNLMDNLDSLSEENIKCKLILRGTQFLEFSKNRKFEIEYRKDFVSDEEIKREIDNSDILYFPLKSDEPNFYLYSLSTKLIGYLGGAGRILYHGPENSAAGNLILKHNCGYICYDYENFVIKSVIKDIIKDTDKISKNAKELAKNKFSLEEKQNQFWLTS